MVDHPPFAEWLDRFFMAYYAARPVNATFVGVHAHDHRLPDWSESGAGDLLAALQTQLRESQTFDSATLTAAEGLDLSLARGFLRTQIWEQGSTHFHRGNPSFYTGEAVFGILALLLTDFAPLKDRVEAAVARMEALPDLLAQGRANVRNAPHAWTERALHECVGALHLFRVGLARLAASEGIADPAFLPAASHAASAFARQKAHLEGELGRDDAAAARYGCGEEGLGLYLREGHFLSETADEIALYAEAELGEAQARVRAGAEELKAASPEAALAALEEVHPSAAHYYACYDVLSREVKERVGSLGLLSWPEGPLRFVPQPEWTREAAPHVYFLPYRAPAAFAAPAVHHCLVPPLDRGGTEAEQRAFLRANNASVIKLNYVVHHAGLGHHVQNLRAAGAASRIGRVAAVDCASRIAFFCGGTMAEGWACYATDLAAEAGLLTPLEVYAEQHTRLRMCARAVVDVRLHQGRFTLEQAAAYYEGHAGMPAGAARREATKNSMFPGAAVMYVMGTDPIHRLRRLLASRPGSAFSLRSFHDELLSYGSVPVSLVARILAGEVADGG